MNARQRKKACDGKSWRLWWRLVAAGQATRTTRRSFTAPAGINPPCGLPTTPAAFIDAIGMRGQWGESCASSPSWDGLPMFYARDSTSGLDVREPIIDGDRAGAIERAMARLQDSVQMWLKRHQIRE